MIDALLQTSPIPHPTNRLAGRDQPGGVPRLKTIVRRVAGDLFAAALDTAVVRTHARAA